MERHIDNICNISSRVTNLPPVETEGLTTVPAEQHSSNPIFGRSYCIGMHLHLRGRGHLFVVYNTLYMYTFYGSENLHG